MHLVKEHIHQLAQEGAKLTREERLHLQDCEDCRTVSNVVPQRFYEDGQVAHLKCNTRSRGKHVIDDGKISFVAAGGNALH